VLATERKPSPLKPIRERQKKIQIEFVMSEWEEWNEELTVISSACNGDKNQRARSKFCEKTKRKLNA